MLRIKFSAGRQFCASKSPTSYSRKTLAVILKNRKKLNKIIQIFIYILFFTSCNSDKEHLELLNQVKNNLEVESNVSFFFFLRNIPLSEILVEARIDKYKIEKSKFKKIDSLTVELNSELNKSIKQISSNKNKTPNNKFYKATLNYLKKIQEMETVLHPFLESIKDTIENNEQSLSIVVKSKSMKIKSETDNWLKVKSEFYEENQIDEKEIDSITELIKKK